MVAACIMINLMQQTLLTCFLQALKDCFFRLVLLILIYQNEG